MAAAAEPRDMTTEPALAHERQDEHRRVAAIEPCDDQRFGAVPAADMRKPIGEPLEPLVGGGEGEGELQPPPQRLRGGKIVEHLDARPGNAGPLLAIRGEAARCGGSSGDVHAGASRFPTG
jgi:hypothetical protein